jgi:putative transposase
MAHNEEKHQRRSIRLKDYDYSQAGAYFVTICVQNRECVLGNVVDGQMQLNDWGRVAEECWMWLADQRRTIRSGEKVRCDHVILSAARVMGGLYV